MDHYQLLKEERQLAMTEDDSCIWMPAIIFLSLGILGIVLYQKRRPNVLVPDSELEAQIGGLRFDQDAMLIMKGNDTIQLTQIEAKLLGVLNESPNQVISRDDILSKVWDDDGQYVGRTLDVTISNLRKKLKIDPTVQIQSERSVGYKLVTEE